MRLTLNKSIINQPSECLQNYSQMYDFSEKNVDVTNYSSVISSIAFSKCTKFLNNCLIEPSLIITKSRAKLKVRKLLYYQLHFTHKINENDLFFFEITVWVRS